MSLILHIGLPKTGTTYLQKTFYKAFSQIENAPLNYPDLNFYNHQIALYEPLGKYLPWAAKPGNPANWQKLKGVLKQPKTQRLLLSAEALSSLSHEGVQEVARLTSTQSIEKIIITTRSLASLLPSHWQQNMKQGGRGVLESYALRILKAIEEDKSPAQMFSFMNTIGIWRRVFGNVPIAVLMMDGNHTQNLYAFAELCGLGIECHARLNESIPVASEQNLSFSVVECRKLLVLNEKIATGKLEPQARKKAIDLFFRSRVSGKDYEKPTLSLASKKLALKIDQDCFLKVQDDAHTHVCHGQDHVMLEIS